MTFDLCSRRVLASAALCLIPILSTRSAAGQQYLTTNVSVPPFSSSRPTESDDAATPSGASSAHDVAAISSVKHGLLQSIGVDVHMGLNGVGGDIALPVTRHFSVRAGGEYFHYTDQFTEQGANVDASLRLGNGKAALDWYPFRNGFRVSPQVVFAIQTQASATVLVPPGQTISLNNSNYVSSTTDPLHGNGLVTTRKSAPGISVGWGNISPRGNGHLTFPVELGFYYIGQPNLQVSFTGSACDPTVPATIGCQSVDQDPSFQASLKAFITRNQHNLSYASFFPIASFGLGYRF